MMKSGFVLGLTSGFVTPADRSGVEEGLWRWGRYEVKIFGRDGVWVAGS